MNGQNETQQAGQARTMAVGDALSMHFFRMTAGKRYGAEDLAEAFADLAKYRSHLRAARVARDIRMRSTEGGDMLMKALLIDPEMRIIRPVNMDASAGALRRLLGSKPAIAARLPNGDRVLAAEHDVTDYGFSIGRSSLHGASLGRARRAGDAGDRERFGIRARHSHCPSSAGR
jgi:hypothetical protein